MMSTWLHVQNLCFVGLWFGAVSIAFFTVTRMSYPSNLMYWSNFLSFWRWHHYVPFAFQKIAYLNPYLVPRFIKRMIMVQSLGKSIAVNPDPIGVFYFTVSLLYSTNVTFILVILSTIICISTDAKIIASLIQGSRHRIIFPAILCIILEAFLCNIY